jgi:hypothetical protein
MAYKRETRGRIGGRHGDTAKGRRGDVSASPCHRVLLFLLTLSARRIRLFCLIEGTGRGPILNRALLWDAGFTEASAPCLRCFHENAKRKENILGSSGPGNLPFR